MKLKRNRKTPLAQIEAAALKGGDVNKHFSAGQKMPPLKEIQRVNVDFSAPMLQRLDQLAEDLNISRQAVIKSLLLFALNSQIAALSKRAGGGR